MIRRGSMEMAWKNDNKSYILNAFYGYDQQFLDLFKKVPSAQVPL